MVAEKAGQAEAAKDSAGSADASLANTSGLRPAAGTPAQVVEAGPGVEVDADLDRAAVQRATGGKSLADVSGGDLLTLAQAKAPRLTSDFVKRYGLSEDHLRAVARGEVPPPPTVGPIHNTDLHLTDGGWQVTPVGVKPEDVGKNAISR
jgi:hypothetical protein